jgi:uncharacterized membrane protein
MPSAEKGYKAPASVGEPFRADPSDPAPFLTDNDTVPMVPVEQSQQPSALSDPPLAHPPSHSPEYGGPTPGTPSFLRPGESAPQKITPPSAEERFGRTALWVGVASIFVFNIFLGPIAIAMGIMAIRRGEKHNGRLAILWGAVGTIVGVVIIVLASMGVIPSFDEMVNDIRNRQ